MKRITSTVLGCLVLISAVGRIAAQENRDQNLYYTLDNGLQVILEARPGDPLAHVAFAIGLGSRDEKESENGLVHLLEHVMLLGGTRDIPAARFAARLRSGGVYFNAHTDHDLMTLEFTLTPDHLEEVLSLAKEKLSACDFVPETVEREKKAILEEINQIQDNPRLRGQQMILHSLFSGHAYARPVYGSVDVVTRADPAVLQAMYRRHFVPGNMSLAVIGGIDAERTQKLIQTLFSGLAAGEKVIRDLAQCRPPEKNDEMTLEMDIQEHHLFLGFAAPSLNDPSRLAFDMVVQILGGGYNPMLRSVLRGNGRGLVESVDPSFITLERGGAYLIHIRCDGDHINSIKRDILQFFTRAARMPFTLDDIHPSQRFGAIDSIQNALTHMTMNYHSFQENGLALATAYARSLLLQKENDSDDYLTRLSRLKSRQLNRVIDQVLAGNKFSQLVIRPLEKK